MPGLGGGLGGGIPAIASLPALPSPTAGMGPTNPWGQLLTALLTVPAQARQAQGEKADITRKRAQAQQMQNQAAQNQFGELQQIARGNPGALNSPAYQQALAQAAHGMGLNPSLFYSPQNGAPTSALGGANVPGAASAPRFGPSASLASGGQTGEGAMPSPGAPGANGPTINPTAINPPLTLSDIMQKQPEFFKALQGASPDQRAGLAASLGITLPDALINMKTTKPASEYVEDLKFLQNGLVSFGKGDMSLGTVRGYLQAIAPKLAEDGLDASALLTPDVTQKIGAAETAKIQQMQRAGLLTDAQARAKLAKTYAEIDNLSSRTLVENKRAAWIDADESSKINQRYVAAQHAAENISLRTSELKLAGEKQDLAHFNASRSALSSAVENLRGQIGQLQATGRSLIANGQDSAPDPNHPGMTYGQAIASQINALQPQLEQATNTLQQASIGRGAVLQRTVQQAVGMPSGRTVDAVGGQRAPQRTGTVAHSPGKPDLYQYSDGQWRPN